MARSGRGRLAAVTLPPQERRRDPERRAAVDVALIVADANAGSGNYGTALQHLAAADALTRGALTKRCAWKRTSWEEAAGLGPSGRPLTAR